MQQLSRRIGFVSPALLCVAFWTACGGNSPDSQPNGEPTAGSNEAGSDSEASAAGSDSNGDGTQPQGGSDAGGEAAGGMATGEHGGMPGEGGMPAGEEAGAAGVEGGAGGTDDQMPGVKVISITPSDGELHVAPLANIVIQLSGPLNEDSLRVPPAVIAPKATLPLTGKMTYDSVNFTITIDPALPMAAGGIHHVNLGGVKDLAGNSVEFESEFRVAFQTVTQINYYALGGAIDHSYVYKLNDEGRMAVRLYVKSLGNDGVVGGDDDEIGGYYNYDWSNEDSDISIFNDPGFDKQWFTKDDVQTGRSFMSAPPVGETRTGARNIGTDGQFGTDDDGWDSFCRVSYAGDGRESSYLCFKGVGADNAAFSDDDVMSHYFLDTFLPGVEPYESGSVRWRPQYNNAGLDKTWQTDDDPSSSLNEFRYDADGFMHLSLQISAGADAEPGTKDDAVDFGISNTRDAEGLALRAVRVDAAGKDQVWETDDDVVATAYWKYKYESDGRLVWMGMYGVGKDLLPFTDDDVLSVEELHDSPL